MQKWTKAKKDKQAVAVNNFSKMDELKKLADLKAAGVLSEAEFQVEKDKLLQMQ